MGARKKGKHRPSAFGGVGILPYGSWFLPRGEPRGTDTSPGTAGRLAACALGSVTAASRSSMIESGARRVRWDWRRARCVGRSLPSGESTIACRRHAVGGGHARRDERSDLVQLGQLRGGTIRARRVASQLALRRPARQTVLRGARRQQFGRRRAGSLGPTIREPHRLGFGLVGSDSAVAAVGDCSASCYAPLGRLSFMRCRRATRLVSGGSRRRRRARSPRSRGRNRWRRPPWPTR